jgi:hypothetical protein
MIQEAERLIGEINQIKEQYQVEVGSKRRPWPNSIKERIESLEKMGVQAKSIASDTGIPYHTILQWRFLKRKKSKPSEFHALAVTNPKLTKPHPTVTVTAGSQKVVTVTVITPLGFRIEGCTESVCRILKSNRGNL